MNLTNLRPGLTLGGDRDPASMPGNPNQAIIDAVERLGAAQVFGLPGADGTEVPVAVLPQGKTLESLKALIDEHRQTPERIRAKVAVNTMESFVNYVIRYQRRETAIFCNDDPAGPSLTGMIDYHGGRTKIVHPTVVVGEETVDLGTDTGRDSPSFCEHRVHYQLALSEYMAAWLNATKRCLGGNLFSQEEFAHFLESRSYDIQSPPADWMMLPTDRLDEILGILRLHDDYDVPRDADGNPMDDEFASEGEDGYVPRTALYKLRRIRFGSAPALVQLSRNIQLEVSSTVENGFNPRTGERTLTFKNEHNATAGGRRVIVPEAFFVNIPVFENGAPRLLPVRLFYRQQGQAVKWGVEMIDVQRLVRQAVHAMANQAGEDTGAPVFFGQPGL
jgi:hypothetical protein